MIAMQTYYLNGGYVSAKEYIRAMVTHLREGGRCIAINNFIPPSDDEVTVGDVITMFKDYDNEFGIVVRVNNGDEGIFLAKSLVNFKYHTKNESEVVEEKDPLDFLFD